MGDCFCAVDLVTRRFDMEAPLSAHLELILTTPDWLSMVYQVNGAHRSTPSPPTRARAS